MTPLDYLPIAITRWYGQEQDFSFRADLTDNFFVYLENHDDAVQVPVQRLRWTTGVLNLASMEIMPYAYTNDMNELPFAPKSVKIPTRVTEDDLKDPETYGRVICEYLNTRMPVRCFYVKQITWTHMFHPTAFCPIPGIIVQFYELKKEAPRV